MYDRFTTVIYLCGKFAGLVGSTFDRGDGKIA